MPKVVEPDHTHARVFIAARTSSEQLSGIHGVPIGVVKTKPRSGHRSASRRRSAS